MVWRVFHHTVYMATEVSGRDDMRFTLCGKDGRIHFLREYIMNLFDLNSDNTIMNIDGKDIEMKPVMCYGKVYEKWLVSKCGKVWSIKKNKLITGQKRYAYNKDSIRKLKAIDFSMMLGESDWWGDGSGVKHHKGYQWKRQITGHKMVIDTWKPLYDNPPEGIVWEEWEIARDLPTVYDHVSKTVVIDHIDDDPTNNHLDNLRRVNSWDNNSARKARGI